MNKLIHILSHWNILDTQNYNIVFHLRMKAAEEHFLLQYIDNPEVIFLVFVKTVKVLIFFWLFDLLM
jgi:hypothetical protein